MLCGCHLPAQLLFRLALPTTQSRSPHQRTRPSRVTTASIPSVDRQGQTDHRSRRASGGQHETPNTRHSTLKTRPSTLHTQPSTLNPGVCEREEAGVNPHGLPTRLAPQEVGLRDAWCHLPHASFRSTPDSGPGPSKSAEFTPERHVSIASSSLPPAGTARILHIYFTQCINQMISPNSMHPQTRQLDITMHCYEIKLTGVWVN